MGEEQISLCQEFHRFLHTLITSVKVNRGITEQPHPKSGDSQRDGAKSRRCYKLFVGTIFYLLCALRGKSGQRSSYMAHQYSTLLYDDSIRLLKLLPASNDANERELSCGLEDCRLLDDPSYEALSYTWGQPSFPELLHTHNGILKITENLALALRRLRFKDRDRYLWVDAVCINQNDDTDKSRQVAMMSSIYKSARRVICWLGQADESISDAMETLKRLAASASRFGITEVSFSYLTNAVLTI